MIIPSYTEQLFPGSRPQSFLLESKSRFREWIERWSVVITQSTVRPGSTLSSHEQVRVHTLSAWWIILYQAELFSFYTTEADTIPQNQIKLDRGNPAFYVMSYQEDFVAGYYSTVWLYIMESIRHPCLRVWVGKFSLILRSSGSCAGNWIVTRGRVVTQ